MNCCSMDRTRVRPKVSYEHGILVDVRFKYINISCYTTMQLEVSEDISKNLEIASKELRIDKKEIILKAIRLYLHNLSEYINLKRELEAWEEAGMEDMLSFEQRV